VKKLVISCEEEELDDIKQVLKENQIRANEAVICEYFDKETLESMYDEELTDEQVNEIEKRWADRAFTCLNAEVMEVLLDMEKEE
jgi:Zn ribbon nucleic-acid-binding protein